MKSKIELSRRQRNIVRTVARHAWQQCNGDRDRAEQLIRDRMPREVGSVFLTIAIKLAIELILYWLRNRTSEPAAVFQAGEPGMDVDEDAEEYGV